MQGHKRAFGLACAGAVALAIATWCINRAGTSALSTSKRDAASAPEVMRPYDAAKPYTLEWASWDLRAPKQTVARPPRIAPTGTQRDAWDGLDVGESR